MVKKILFISLALFGLLFSTMPPACFADAAAQLEQAETYKQNEQYEQAEAIYRDIVADYPGTDEAFQAQKSLALLYIKTARYPAARQEVDTLTTNFADHPELPGEVYNIARQYWRRRRLEDAKSLYEYIAENHSDSDFAIKAHRSAVRADMKMGNDEAVQAGIDALIRDFAEDPRLAGMLWGLGNISWQQEKYNWSRQLYQHTFETDPQGPLAIQAKAGVVGADIRMGNDEAAQAGIDRLIADFADNPKLPGEIYKIEAHYWHMKRYKRVKLLCEYIAANHPESDVAVEARASVAAVDIMLGNDAAAQAGIDALIRDFAKDPRLAGMLCKLGNISCEGGKYEKAAELYQYVIDNWPKTEHEMQAKTGIAKLNISLGNDAAVEATIDSLIADFNDHPRLPWAVFVIGERYYNWAFQCENQGLDAKAKDKFQKATEVWERIITELPTSGTTAEAYYFSAVCYGRLGEYEKAIRYYQRVVDYYPEYDLAWNALFRVGDINQVLKKSGAISQSNADLKTKAAYEQLLERYPNCKVAEYVRDWLSR